YNTPLGGPFNLGPKPLVSAAEADQARLAQRRGEWFAGEQNIYAPLDAHDRHPAVVAVDPEIQRFVAYSNELAAAIRIARRDALSQRKDADQSLDHQARLDTLAQIKDE